MYRGNIIIFGSSTGGPKILKDIFSSLPVLNAAIIIVQHIQPEIDRRFVERLNDKSAMNVKIAENRSILETGQVYFAPARIHLKLVNNEKLELFEGEKVNFVCPSADVTMCSIVKHTAGKLVGIVLTGMGKDGATGITHIKKLSGITISQKKETCAVYGMPMEAEKTGNVDFVLTPDEIVKKLIQLAGTIRQ